MALIDCQRRFRENNFRINVYLYGNLNGINVTFGVTVVPIQNFKLYLNILPTEKVNKGLKSLWHFECHCRCLDKDCSSRFAEI